MQSVIRHTVEADLPAVVGLLGSRPSSTVVRAPWSATPDLLHEAWFSASPRAFALVADLDGLLVGLATYYPTFSTFLARSGLWLDDLFVREGYRNRGVGLALMARLACVAEDRGCGRIEWTVALSNERGIAFYERHHASVRHGSRYVRLASDGISRLARQDHRFRAARQGGVETGAAR